jgi:hypothetical protein
MIHFFSKRIEIRRKNKRGKKEKDEDSNDNSAGGDCAVSAATFSFWKRVLSGRFLSDRNRGFHQWLCALLV